MATADTIHTIRDANVRLRQLLVRLEQGANEPAGDVLQDVAAALSAIQAATQRLRELRSKSDSSGSSQEELLAYRDTLVALRDALPALQARLFLERARLDGEVRHRASCAAWSEANKATL